MHRGLWSLFLETSSKLGQTFLGEGLFQKTFVSRLTDKSEQGSLVTHGHPALQPRYSINTEFNFVWS